MNFALKYSQMKVACKLLKFQKKCNVTTNYDSCRSISYSKICCLRRDAREKLKIANEYFAKEKSSYENTFGNLENYEIKFEKLRDDPEDVEEYMRRRAAQGKTIIQYISEIQNHLKNLDYDKAINVLEVDMVNDAKPTVPYIYRVLINYNGNIGNIEEAYRLYIRYKKRQGKTNGAIITSLFNACANSKNSLLALEKANKIRESLSNDENYTINISNYNAMLKAYGRHGDLKTSLQIVDEVLERKDKVKIETYGFLLQACASDTNSGLRHALMVWRKMLQYRLKPRIYEFNVMLRCVRDCFIGEPELLEDFVKKIQAESNKFYKRKVLISAVNNEKKRKVLNIPLNKEEVLKYFPNKSDQRIIQEAESTEGGSGSSILTIGESEPSNQVEASSKSDSVELEESKKEILNDTNTNLESPENFNSEVPNLITTVPSLGSVISFTKFTKPYEKLLLLGGINGFLETMSEFDVKPNMKTFTFMLDIIPSTTQDEENLMKIMEAYEVKPDNIFLNVLIKRRSLRGDLSSVHDSLLLMQKENITPDVITFGVIAISCNTLERAVELVDSVHNFGHRLNGVILETLLRNALKIQDWHYVKQILAYAKEDEVEVSPAFTALLSRAVAREKSQRNEMSEKVIPALDE